MRKHLFLILFSFFTIQSIAQIKLVSSNPENGDFAVTQDSIVLEFNLPVDINIENPDSNDFYFFLGHGENEASFDSMMVSEDGLTVTLYTQLTDDTDYIAILEDISGQGGESLESPAVIQFTTADQAGPYSVSGTVSNESLQKPKLPPTVITEL